MKQLQRGRTGEKNLRIAIVAMCAVLWLCIAFFAGCGTNSGDSVSYDGTGDGTANPTATATVPFQDQPLNFLTSTEDANGGMAVSFIDLFGAGIYANANKNRASNKGAAGTIISLTAKVLVNVVKNFAIGNPTQQEFATVQNELNSINSEIYQLNSEAATCMDQLAITEADLTTYINNITISQYTEDIDTYYASGSLKNLLYYSYCATVFCPAGSSPSPSPTVTALPYSIPTPSPIPMPTWPLPSSLASVQQSIYSSDANCYVTEVTGTESVPYDIKMIHDGICSSNEQMLMAYVNDVILNGPSTSGSTTTSSSSGSGKKAQKGGSPKADSSPTPTYTPHTNIANPTSQDSVMNTYLLLEKYFLTLYCYQLKGLLILQNADNVLDSMNPNPPNPSTFSNYMNSRFKPWIMDELLAYNNAVNYLVVSMVDYRTKDQFNSDNNYLATGIAKDSVYYQVLARARILTVQILNSYGYDEGGLYGKIIVPANYLGSGTTATPEVSPTVTPTFSPAPFPTPLVNLAGSPTPVSSLAPLTQKMTTYRSIFPYPSWCRNYVSCDNNWTVADLYNTDLPSGTYTLTLNDGGSSITPWNHSNTQLGSGTVMYYCPNGNSSKYPPTSQPTDTNTVKFGFFSGRWNFGYEIFSNGPFSYWNVSGDQYQFDYDGDIDTFPNPALCDYADGNSFFSKDFAAYLYPYDGNTLPTDFINKMGSYSDTYTDEQHKAWFTAYKIYLRYFMASAPGNIVPQGLSGQVNATWIYNVTGGMTGADTSKPQDYLTNYCVYSEDNGTKDKLYLVNENNNLGSSLSWNDVKQITMNPGIEYDLKTSCYYLNNLTGTYSQYLQWYLQLVYSGYVDIFATP
ncbi:MAG: hypothetical protein AB2L14_12455 [Candidatus Xenobiia bacterium LiM19]